MPKVWRRLAGGEANRSERNHRVFVKKLLAPRQGRWTDHLVSATPAGAVCVGCRKFRWFRFATPPANLSHPVGTLRLLNFLTCTSVFPRFCPLSSIVDVDAISGRVFLCKYKRRDAAST